MNRITPALLLALLLALSHHPAIGQLNFHSDQPRLAVDDSPETRLPPRPEHLLADEGEIFSIQEREELQDLLRELEEATGMPVYVVTEPMREQQELETLSAQIADAWLPGRQGILVYATAESHFTVRLSDTLMTEIRQEDALKVLRNIYDRAPSVGGPLEGLSILAPELAQELAKQVSIQSAERNQEPAADAAVGETASPMPEHVRVKQPFKFRNALWILAGGLALLLLILLGIGYLRGWHFLSGSRPRWFPVHRAQVRLDGICGGGHGAVMKFSSGPSKSTATNKADKANILLCLLAGCFWFSTANVSAQVDPENRRFLDFGVSIPTQQANPAYSGVIYWNQTEFPTQDTHFNVLFAGPFNSFGLIWPEAFGPDTAFIWRIGSLIHFDTYTPEYLLGAPLRDEQFDGYSGFTSLGINHEVGRFTGFEIPLNFSVEYKFSYTTYSRKDETARDFRIPNDHFGQELEFKLQLGGMMPGIKSVQGLDLSLRYIIGHKNNWQDWGPESDLFQAEATGQRLVLGAGISAPFIANQTFGLQLTAQKGFNLDRTTMTGLGGSIRRAEQATRIMGYYASEFLAEDYFLANFSYEIPITEWQDISAHFYADNATFRRTDDRGQGWENVTGLGTGLSFTGPYDSQFIVTYGYGVDAIRKGERGGHEVGMRMFIPF